MLRVGEWQRKQQGTQQHATGEPPDHARNPALSRQALEPRLVGKQVGLNPVLTLLALYTGYRLLGAEEQQGEDPGATREKRDLILAGLLTAPFLVGMLALPFGLDWMLPAWLSF